MNLPPPALPRRRIVDAKQLGETVNLRPPGASAPMSAVSTSTAAAAAGGNDAGDADGDNERDVSQSRKTFSTPEEIRTLFRALT